MADFLMPALGADMETGKVVQWLVTPGSRVKRGDVVAVVETHKGAIDVEIFLEGEIDDLVPLGTELPIGAVLAHVRVAGGKAAGPTPSPSVRVEPATAAVTVPSLPARAASSAAVTGVRAKVSPAARRRAQERGVDPQRLHGTGVEGSVTLADVELAVSQPTPVPPPAATAHEHKGGFDIAQMRQAIAMAMSRSKREIPHYYLASTLDFGAAGAWLASYNRGRAPADQLLPAVLLLKATARGLAERPQLNGFYVDGAFRPGPGVHVGWAIALRGGGLVAPAIHDVDRKPLAELMTALRELIQRARTGGLRSSELTDPTVTITSLGDRGAESVLGIIYPPQVAMVGFGRVLERPWVVDGGIAPRQVVAASLSGDHRASDGHLGGLLLAAIDRALQSPETL